MNSRGKPTRLRLAVFYTILQQLCLIAFSSLHSYDDDDKITALPGQPSVEFQQFAGYIPVDKQKQRFLFYYFVEAETHPHSKPLVLFLAGGPGCSSLGDEAFSGGGPFRPDGKRLVRNKYSWVKDSKIIILVFDGSAEANMLYVDSPVGVGFSNSSNNSFYNTVNDKITARDNFNFLQNWLAKYSSYKKRDLFITGSRYGGHYVPQLANLVLKSNLKPNLKGIAVAGPLLVYNSDYNSRAEYLWSHGLISDSTYHALNKICNFAEITRDYVLKGQISPACFQVASLVGKEFGGYVNPNDISTDVCLLDIPELEKESKNPHGSPDICIYEKTTLYLRRKDVQTAFNAKLVEAYEYNVCVTPVNNYDYRDMDVSSLPALGILVKSGVRVFIYSGDQDPIVPFTATRTHIDTLAKELGLNVTLSYQSWMQDKQVGGWTQAYGDMLTYATVRGAGHDTGHSQPKRSLTIFRSFLKGKPLPMSN